MLGLFVDFMGWFYGRHVKSNTFFWLIKKLLQRFPTRAGGQRLVVSSQKRQLTDLDMSAFVSRIR